MLDFPFVQAMWTTIQTYREFKDSWEGIKTRGMKQDMTWNRAAAQYEQIFEWAMKDPPYAWLFWLDVISSVF